MKIYILTWFDSCEGGIYGQWYFSSEQNREKFYRSFLKKHKHCNGEDLDYEEEELDPDSSWMEE